MDKPFIDTLHNWGIVLSEAQLRKLELFHCELLDKNTRFNLISENDASNIWPRHILDALAGAPLLRKHLSSGSMIADAGAGAGFPGIPLAVALEDMEFRLWDSNLKRHMFLNCAISALKLKNASAHHLRIGQSGEMERGKHDAVIERAMGKLENILPQCLNMLRPGGIFMAWQSAPLEKEPSQLQNILAAAGGKVEEIFAYRLPTEDKERFIAVFRRI